MNPEDDPSEFTDLNPTKIREAVAQFATKLNLTGGSAGVCDLYVLMSNYLINYDVRKAINSILLKSDLDI